MNREQRRKAAKTGQVSKALKVIENESIEHAVNLYTIAFAWQLYNKRHWLPGTILTLLDQVHETFDAINQGYVDLVDIRQTLKDEVGLVLKK